MSARSIGSGTISFGLVSIPIKLYSTGQSSSGISFNLIHKDCGSRLKQQYLCAKENVVVERSDMVKGYEFAKDQYVLFTDEELKALEEQASEAIEITEFVPAPEVDPVYFEKAYYLGPDKGAERSYRLLSEAMSHTDHVALAKYSARGKQYLVLLRPKDKGIVMQQLRYADEVRPMSEVPLGPDVEVKEQELKLAGQLIDQITHETFEPEKYEDSVRMRIQTIIDKKIQGEVVVAEAPAAPQGQIIDLMEALKASLAQRPGETAEGTAAEGRKPPKKAPRAESAPASKRGKAK